MKVGEKLIHKPSLQPGLQHTFFSLATLMAWSAYLYLWAPLVTLALWWAGARSTYIQLYLQHNQVNLPLLLQLLVLASVCATLLIGWAEYNRIRFQGVDRRGRQPDTSLADIALAMGMPIEQASALQDARIATVRVDGDIALMDVTPTPPSVGTRGDAGGPSATVSAQASSDPLPAA